MKRALAHFIFVLFISSPGASVAQTGGGKSSNFTKSVPRIAGAEAPVGRFPYVCSLLDRVSEKHVCGGTLFRQKWVVTAAHCIDPSRSGTVGRNPLICCGIHDLDEDTPELTFNGVAAHVHHSWTGDLHKGYDIAAIKLDRTANITLPGFATQGGEFRHGQEFTAVGWGKTPTGAFPDRLQMADNLVYLPPRRCTEEFGNEMEEQMICAGLMGEDTCEGDSGGPLLIPNKPDGNLTAGRPERDLIIGVTSFGSGDCGGRSPGVYLSIGYFWDWLTDVADGNIAKNDSPSAERTSTEDTVEPENAASDEDHATESIQLQPSEEEMPSSLEDDSNGVVSSSNSDEAGIQVSENRTEAVELSAKGDVSLTSWPDLERDAGYFTRKGVYRGGRYKKARESYHEEFRCTNENQEHCLSWKTTNSSDDQDPTVCHCRSGENSPVCELWYCSRDDRECVCEARSAKDPYCLRWSCSQKPNGEPDGEEYYECAAGDVSGEYCRDWQGNISSSYQISSAVCRCTEAKKKYCTRWECNERRLVRCESHSGGWCDMGLALGVGGVFGALGAFVASSIATLTTVYTANAGEILSSFFCSFTWVFVAHLICVPWLFGILIWGGAMGIVWSLFMWFCCSLAGLTVSMYIISEKCTRENN